PDAPRPLLTAFLEGEGAPAPRNEAAVLASLHPPAEPCEGGVVRVWLKNVRRHLASLHVAGVPFADLPEALGSVVLARALGRALAHEIGHYLLGTSAHSERGLMRAHYAPIEFSEALSPRYGLSVYERERLASCRSDLTQPVAGVQ